MQLPKPLLPEFECTLPLSKKKITFKPFLAGAEKIFLIALQNNEVQDFIRAIHQVVSLCVITKVDVKNLPLRDLEYLFLKIRCKSISEEVNPTFKCKTPNPQNPDGICGNTITYKINLETDLKIKTPPDKHNIITLQDSPLIGVKMRYPRFEVVDAIAKMKNIGDIEATFAVIKDCVENVFDAEKVYTRDKFNDQELAEFLESLTQASFARIKTFFDTIPNYIFEAPFNCNKCGNKTKIKLEGIEDFFA